MRKLGTLLCLLGVGCGGITANLSDELFRRLSHDDRAAIYERQNEVTIAYSRRDEAQLQVSANKTRLNELDDRWARCRTRLEKANQSARIDVAKKMKDTQNAFLDDQLRIAELHLRFRDSEIDAARARLELAKQRQLVKSGLAAEKTLDAFDKLARDTEEEARNAEHKELEVRAEAQKKFLEWKAAENDYARNSGDYDSLIWID
jgi:hypothetical protein